MKHHASRSLYLRLLRNVAPYWRTFALALLALVVLAATEPALPALLKPMLDGSFVKKDLRVAEITALLLVVVFFVRGASSFLSAAALSWVSGKLVMDLRGHMFRKLTALPTRYYDHNPSGALISKLTFDVTQVTEAATHVLTVLVRDILSIVGLLAWMLYLDWKLTLVALLAAPLIVVIVRKLSSRLREMSRSLQRSMGQVTHLLQETIDGHKVVRVFGGEDYERGRFAHSINAVRRFQFKFATAAAANAPVAQLVTACALAAIVYLAARQSAAGEITVGGFVSFFSAMGMIFAPLKRITNVNGPLQKGLAAAESVFALIDEAAEPDRGTRVLPKADGALELRRVTFTYPGSSSRALRDISLRIEAGETVALVGPSGAGKTTLVNLVPRFYAPSNGQILLDDIDIETLTLQSLRSNIALVSQDIVLFNDTIRANIAYGPLAHASDDAVRDALTAAHAQDFLDELPEGLDTVIGTHGMRLSGGQRQRLAIARAFLKDAPILIFDEATSSLDSLSEGHIQAALEDLRRGRTTIIIAHRLSTIERADRIVVMANGRIVEAGTHASLLEKNNLYAGLYRFQFSRRPAVGQPASTHRPGSL